ncbi:MAG TPA: HD-GYP domain-containing protein [Actinomycetota bacterium]
MAGDRRRRRQKDTWRSHGPASFLVRALVLLVPVGAGVATAILVGSVLPLPAAGADDVVWWVLVLGSSTLAALLTDHLARKLLPLAVLLKLTLVFPDRAPSRFALARAAGSVRSLERRVREARERGVGDVPARAAETVLVLIAALGAHDRRTRGHSERVRAFTDVLSDELKLPPGARARLRWAALLHDIGKLEVTADILNKPGELDEREWDLIRDHPEAGARLVGPLLPWLGEWGRAIPEHHERYNGSGYPQGISGENISLAARITSIADAYETMTAARTYKPSLGVRGARRELARHAGSQFDPTLVRAFLNVSLGRLLWISGPLTWIAQVPIVRGLARSGEHQPVQAAASWALIRTIAGVLALGMTGAIAPRSSEPPNVAGAGPALEQEAEDRGENAARSRDVDEAVLQALDYRFALRRPVVAAFEEGAGGVEAPSDQAGGGPDDGSDEGPGDPAAQPPEEGPGEPPGGGPPGGGPPGGGPGQPGEPPVEGPPGKKGRRFDPPPLKPPPDPPPADPPPVDPPPG